MYVLYFPEFYMHVLLQFCSVGFGFQLTFKTAHEMYAIKTRGSQTLPLTVLRAVAFGLWGFVFNVASKAFCRRPTRIESLMKPVRKFILNTGESKKLLQSNFSCLDSY